MKNPTEKELKELLKLAYQAGELGQKEKTRIDRMIEDGTKSFPKSPNFNDWYDTGYSW